MFDWDEINFAEAAREMLITGDYFRVTIDYQPFWEKPPLFIWLQALAMSVFGVNEFAARLPNALCGIATLIVIFNIGKKLYDKNFGIYWVLVYAGSFLPHFYFMSGIIDPLFNLFIFLGIYYISGSSSPPPTCLTGRQAPPKGGESHRARNPLHQLYKQMRGQERRCYLPIGEGRGGAALFSGIFIGLAILTKGPVALLIFLLCVFIYEIFNKFRFNYSFREILLFTIAITVVSFLWYGVELIRNGIGFFKEFILYHLRLFQTGDAGHGQPFYYHFIVLLIGCLPASVLIFKSFSKQKTDNDVQSNFKKWMIILFWVVLLLFSIVKTKILHYSSLCYFPLTFLAAYYIYNLIHKNVRWAKALSYLLIIIGGLFAIALAAIPFAMINKEALYSYIKDDFAIASLSADVHWTGFESIPGIAYLVIIGVVIALLNKEQYKQAFLTLFISSTLITNLTIKIITPKIERFTQGAAIDFYKSIQGEDCYVEVLDFKSYAHLFYTKKQPVRNEKSRDREWLLTGDIDKPAYFVCKNTNADRYRKMPQLKEIKEENGFVFFKREK